MKTLLGFAIALAAASPAVSQAPQPATVSVTLSNFKFNPAELQMQAGVPTVLHLVNTASGGHNFTAPEFFAAAKIAPASQALVREGKIEVPKHSALDVTLTPVAGKYSLKCTHMLHSSFGMNGSITVH
jgi:plastocyanin